MLVLLVEDDADLSAAIADLLEVDGYEPTRVATVAEARKAMKSKRFDVAILDWMLHAETSEDLMPDLSAARVPSVLYSANDAARAVAAEWNIPFVSKPFEVEQLLEEVTTSRAQNRVPVAREGQSSTEN